MSGQIFPVILSGGCEAGLWPLSRENFPKQLLAVVGERTLLQEAALRMADPLRFHPPTVIANAEHRFIVAEQLRQADVRSARIILEPCTRDTAVLVAVAALLAAEEDPDALVLVMPCGLVIADPDLFPSALDEALPAVRDGALVSFGAGAGGERGGSSGVFLLMARAVISELEAHEPKVVAAARAALGGATVGLDFIRLDATALADCPAISLEQALMERATVVPARFAWSKAGSWSDLWKLAGGEARENVEIGDVLAEDTKGSYLRSEGPLIAAVGVEDLVVVATPDAVLVTRRGHDEAVRTVVERLKASNHASAAQTRRVYRPWGWYEGLDAGERFQVKRITVNPGGQLSLQRHFHRAEHWVVVNGSAEVQVGDEKRLISENEAVDVPLGALHRLANPGKVPLNLIEVQCGAYLGEDDIVRIADIYART